MSDPAGKQPVSSSNNRGGPADQAVAMDRMYRLTRHVYDLTRHYYLLGRDRMLDKVATSPTTSTLEVGCGTARNLIKLARRAEPGLLCGLDAKTMFGRDEPFDTIYFSYCLSMVPTWPGAIEAALANLRPGGVMLIVDFWDQKELPPLFAAALKKWLSLFHVHYRPEVHDALVELGKSGRAEVTFESVARRYAYIATVRKN